MSTVVVRGDARALSLTPDLPDLLIAGNLGAQHERICDAARERAGSINDYTFLAGSRTKRSSSVMQLQHCASSPRCTKDLDYSPWKLLHVARQCHLPRTCRRGGGRGCGDHYACDRDETSLAECIARLWSDTARRSTLRENGPRRARCFSWVRTATLLADLLVKLGPQNLPADLLPLTSPLAPGDM